MTHAINTKSQFCLLYNYAHLEVAIHVKSQYVLSSIKNPIARSCILWQIRFETLEFVTVWKVTKMFSCMLLFLIENHHCDDVMMTTMAAQITSLTVVYPIVYSDANQRKHQSSASLAFVRGIHRWPVNSPHKLPVTLKVFPFDDVIMHLVCKTFTHHWFFSLIFISKHIEKCARPVIFSSEDIFQFQFCLICAFLCSNNSSGSTY